MLSVSAQSIHLLLRRGQLRPPDPTSRYPARASQMRLAVTTSIVESADNTRALTALAEAHIPFIGVGFGSDLGVRTLSLREVQAPPIVSPKTAFSISAQLARLDWYSSIKS